MNKLITELRKFGYSQGKAILPDQVKSGYGDQVCHIIDELLNLELYRREFQFLQPQFPPDDEEEPDEEEHDQDASGDLAVVINGGQIEAT